MGYGQARGSSKKDREERGGRGSRSSRRGRVRMELDRSAPFAKSSKHKP